MFKKLVLKSTNLSHLAKLWVTKSVFSFRLIPQFIQLLYSTEKKRFLKDIFGNKL